MLSRIIMYLESGAKVCIIAGSPVDACAGRNLQTVSVSPI